jgi:uncharacterized membrane protein YkvA (DUF1232 family)
MTTWQRLKSWALRLKRDVKALGFALFDARTPWYAKALAFVIVAYALSPIDLIPDFVPVLGLVDDMIVVPLLMIGALRLIPADVMADCRARAAQPTSPLPGSLRSTGLALVVGSWLIAVFFLARWLDWL